MDINKATCGRCGGTGKHSYNMRDGDVCYGCGGTGEVIVAPKGQKKKVKPTATFATAKVGDTVLINKVLCEVTSIKWIQHKPTGFLEPQYNQVMRYTRLVNGEKMKTWRTAYTSSGNFIEVTDEMKGTEVA